MADDHRRRESPTGSASDEGVRPSERARERFAADIRSEVELTRAAWQDAMLRGRERLVAGDDHGAMEAIEDQRRLLHLLEHRLERVVVAAVVEREAEGVLDRAGAQPTAGQQPPPVPGEVTPPVPTRERDVAPRGSGGRLRALVAAGAAAAVTAIAVGLGTLVGPVSTPAPEVAGPVDGAEEAWSGAGATPDQDVGTADRTSPTSAAPPLRAPWPHGWMDHGSSADDAGSATSFDTATSPDRREAGAHDVGEGEDARHTTDIPDAPPSDGTRDDDGARDEDEIASDPDEGDADDEDALAELRRLVQPDDDAPEDEDGSPGEDEELPSADGDATSSPEGDGDDGDDEAPAGPRDPEEPRSRLGGGA